MGAATLSAASADPVAETIGLRPSKTLLHHNKQWRPISNASYKLRCWRQINRLTDKDTYRLKPPSCTYVGFWAGLNKSLIVCCIVVSVCSSSCNGLLHFPYNPNTFSFHF